MTTPPREVPDKDSFYMGLAFMVGGRSKDPNTQVGSLIVSPKNVPLGWGFNGPPRRIADDQLDWSRPNKYPFVQHSERNAIKYARGETVGATIYITAPPCPPCMLAIVDAEIDRVVYFRSLSRDNSSMTRNEQEWCITQDIANRGGVRLEEFAGEINWLVSWVGKLEEAGAFSSLDRHI